MIKFNKSKLYADRHTREVYENTQMQKTHFSEGANQLYADALKYILFCKELFNI